MPSYWLRHATDGGRMRLGGWLPSSRVKMSMQMSSLFPKFKQTRLVNQVPDMMALGLLIQGLCRSPERRFEHVLGEAPHQKHVMREDVMSTDRDILNFDIEGGTITETGVRHNLNVGVLYIESWLNGVGAAAIYDLMEDAATAEISRSQVWQWVNHADAKLADGRDITADMVKGMLAEEVLKIEELVGRERFANGKFTQAAEIMENLVIGEYVDFLTLPAYELL